MPPAKERSDLAQDNIELKRDLIALQEELRQKNVIIAQNESELFKLRHKAFERLASDEAEEYSPELIGILKKGRAIADYDIFKALKIDPSDSMAVKLVSNQLEELRRFGLVKETNNGWKWIR